jgi:transcriptional regulator with XRE-family HTH domain
MNYEQASKELIRALRGKRSQLQISRRLGLLSNAVYRWETGRSWPTAQQLLQLVRATGRTPQNPLASHGATFEALQTPVGMATWLGGLVQGVPLGELAKRLGVSRFVVSRWLSGKSALRVPELLRFVDVTTHRLVDFVGAFVDATQLPTLALAAKRLSAARQLAYDAPWSHAVLRAIELDDYRSLRKHEPGWIARRIGIPLEEEERCLSLLLASGQVQKRRARYVSGSQLVVDTSTDARKRELRAFWAEQAVQRLAHGHKGVFAYNLFSIAASDVEKLLELHREFFAKLRTLVDESAANDRVMLYATQLLALDGQPELA